MASHHAGNGLITRSSLEVLARSPQYVRLHRRRPDATQQAMLQLLELSARSEGPSGGESDEHERQVRLGGYLRAAAWNCARSDFKKQQRLPTDESPDEAQCNPWDRAALDPERELLARQVLRRLALTEDEMRLLASEELLEPDDEAIAAALGISRNTLQKRRSRQRARLAPLRSMLP